METVQWGIIGCGDVTEVKSGPAFNKVPNSKLLAVMRRNEEKVKDYAKKHNVPKWYTDAFELINDPEINAIYVATPPLQHEEYAIAAINAGKPVYIEKPMAVDAASAKRIADVAKNNKVSVAHYRRAQPLFIKLKELLESDIIGEIRYINLKFLQVPLSNEDLQLPKVQWRVDPALAGGGLFHDLAPHQLDLMLYYFGKIKNASGYSANQGRAYYADDIVSGNILFESGVIFQGLWCFNVPKEEAVDKCEFVGSKGKISVSIFGEPEITLVIDGKFTKITLDKLQHVQQPMIEKVVQYFLGEGENPSSADEGVEVMTLLEAFTNKSIK
ncbi:Gfo/Idh/MocA family protein [Segetibacter aerophilus]|uniref:Oxidoreductase n=1 Tax=Segetibacter aerophilus TaxID=670293 RepID=A0A512BGQ3_9BACT|nr:Gfo/Idh/MocA family oxidoreductase [Segetibacter aerophilus]GEO11007.1 oxidoreductase [Segetibacter aerophilus]